MLVYLATNLVNNKKYVGYTTKSLEERKKNHYYKSKSKNNKHYFYLLPLAIRKYGFNNFKWEVLFETDSITEVQEKEKYYIKHIKTISPNGYNLTIGGNGGIQSDETKDKISKSVKEYWLINKEKHHWNKVSSKKRKEWSKKAWETKRKNGYIPKTGFKRSKETNIKQSKTKNELNKRKWVNLITGEEIYLSSKQMSEYTNLSVGVFNHLKNGRQKKTKCGWEYVEN